MKKTVLLLFCLLLLPLASCQARFRTDASLGELCQTALEALPREDYRLDTDGLMEDYLTLPEDIEESAVFYSEEIENADEFGIFLCRDEESAHALEDALRTSYLTPVYQKNREFYDSYIPHETPKLRDAAVRRFGSLVLYAVLSPADQNALFHAAEKYMKE